MAPNAQEWVKDKVVRGLYQRVTSKSSTWAVKGRRRGSKSVLTITIGPTRLLNAQQARGRAKAILAQLTAGIDPNAEKREKLAAEAASQAEQKARSITLADALNDFLAIGDRKALTIKDCRQTTERNFKDWLDRPLNSISGRDVQERFLEIQERVRKKREELNQRRSLAGESLTTFNNKDGKGEAQRAFRYLRAIFNMVRADEINGKPLLNRNPVDILKAKRLTRSLIPRDRYLRTNERLILFDELRIVEHPEYNGPLSPDDADFVYLLSTTGLRVDEARTLRWVDVNFAEGLFVAHNTKNRMKHTLPMTMGVGGLLRRRYERIGSVSPWVFPSKSDPTKCSSMSRTFERLRAATGLVFTAHDLRRTVATVASEMGYDLERIGAVLNHSKSGITSRYIQTTIESLRETLQTVEDVVLENFGSQEME